ncbi:iron complex transport system substrate-binding protein [Jatrophihabitans endophyticus]|uniref:Iron complex transport system substrate-binding protein n=1 Tax=Jatrophihabitans endophyticus TaxID=1206085 RepID=A0A1M5Q3G7_9ACTN|nr:ABC transporter substrate-binding protein [Jatrophihabitans endophyticus]SHH08655.1 iron complex transport system substrate-binding protein [Jatrophihabitans endophyticus]
MQVWRARQRAARLVVVATAAVVALAAAGCDGAAAPGSSTGDPRVTERAQPLSALTAAPDARALTGPTTATVADADIVPITRTPHPVLPATVTDVQGTRVAVRSAARILALDLYGSLAATVAGLGLGDRLVGRDVSTGFPSARALPVVTTNGHQLNAEAILALHPSVLITDTTLGPWDAVLQVRDAGIPVVVVSAQRTLGTVGTLVGEVAAALGVRAEGRTLTSRLHGEIARTEQQIRRITPRDPARRPRIVFLYARGQSGVYYLFGKGSGADSLITAIGGIDVASENGVRGFTPLNAEALAKAKPDVILMMTKGLESVGGVSGALQLPGVAQSPAGLHRRIVDASDYEVLSFGPLTAQVLAALARAVYAPGS